MAMAGTGLVLSAYAPATGTTPDNARALLLFIPIAVLVFRLRGLVLRHLFPAVRRCWFRLWRATAAVDCPGWSNASA